MYEAGELKKGLKITIDGDPYVIVDFDFVKPGKGQALYKCKLKNMKTGAQFDHTFRSGDKVGKADLEERKMEYLYADNNGYCFMDSSTYEQVFVTAEQISEVLDLLKENTVCDVLFFENTPIGITLPNFIELVVVEGTFGPALIQELSRKWRIPANFMFIGSPGDHFLYGLAELGGVRLII